MVRLRAVGGSSRLEIKSLTVSLMSFLVGERKIFVGFSIEYSVGKLSTGFFFEKVGSPNGNHSTGHLRLVWWQYLCGFELSVLSAAHSSPVRLEYWTDVLIETLLLSFRMSWRHFLTKRSTEANRPAARVQLDFYDSSCRVDQISRLFCVQFGSELVRFL